TGRSSRAPARTPMPWSPRTPGWTRTRRWLRRSRRCWGSGRCSSRSRRGCVRGVVGTRPGRPRALEDPAGGDLRAGSRTPSIDVAHGRPAGQRRRVVEADEAPGTVLPQGGGEHVPLLLVEGLPVRAEQAARVAGLGVDAPPRVRDPL